MTKKILLELIDERLDKLELRSVLMNERINELENKEYRKDKKDKEDSAKDSEDDKRCSNCIFKEKMNDLMDAYAIDNKGLDNALEYIECENVDSNNCCDEIFG